MRTIEGVEYVSLTDLAELWGVEHVYTIRNRMYAEIRRDNRFPEPDISKRTTPIKTGGGGGSTPALWRADRLPELTAWWDTFKDGPRRREAVKTAPVSEPTAKPEPTVLFTDANITLTIAEDFPKMRESHVLAIVRRGESATLDHYFITREDAEFILSLFE